MNREAARRAAGRTPAVNGPDSTNRRSRLGRTKCARRVSAAGANQIRCAGAARRLVRQYGLHGEVPEWSNGPDSKSGVRSPVPWVRIPPSPPEKSKAPLWGLLFFSPSVVEDESPVRPTRQRSCQFARQRRRRNSIPPSPPTSQAFDESPTGDRRMPLIFRSF